MKFEEKIWDYVLNSPNLDRAGPGWAGIYIIINQSLSAIVLKRNAPFSSLSNSILNWCGRERNPRIQNLLGEGDNMILRTPPPKKQRAEPIVHESPSAVAASEGRLVIYEDTPAAPPPESPRQPSDHLLCTYQCRQMVAYC